ncbi:MAG: POTRA domain-containing protein, partial [Nitrospiraceae bacterium]
LERLAKTFREKLKDSGYRDAMVQFDLVPVGLRQADVLFRVKAGKRYVVDSVEVSGMSHQDSRQVAKILNAVQPRTLVPGIPGVWKGWKLRRPLNQEDLNLVLRRLRSHYISRGHLDATTNVEAIAFEENLASISIRVVPGTAYRVESLQAFDALTPAGPDTVPNQLALPDLCECLREKRAQAERRGVFDFAAQLLVRPTYETGEFGTQPGVSLSARIKTGPPYRVGRIEFRGNHEFGDLTLRKVLLLSEGEWFDLGLLRRSLTRLDLTGLVHPVTEFDVEIQPDLAQHLVDLVIPVRERDRGRWFLSAPVWGGHTRAGFSISLRLPNWGPPYLELPTHFVALTVTSPLLGLPRSVFNQAHRSISLARPYFPGQSWRSGFHVSPQFTWPQMLLAPG